MSKLRLTFACGPYDRTQAVRDGTIPVEGVELNYITMQPAEIFWRQLQFQEFDASEMSLSNYNHAGGLRKIAVHRHSGLSVAGVPARLLLRQHRQGHQERRGPQR